MAIAKLTSTKKAFLFIDDEGNVFMVSRVFIESLLKSNESKRIVLLTRLPNKTDVSRFKPSPVLVERKSGEPFRSVVDGDPLSKVARENKKLAENYADKDIWGE